MCPLSPHTGRELTFEKVQYGNFDGTWQAPGITVLFRALRCVTGHRPSRRRRNRSRPRSLSAAANLPDCDIYPYFFSPLRGALGLLIRNSTGMLLSIYSLEIPLAGLNQGHIPLNQGEISPRHGPPQAAANLYFRRGCHRSHPAANCSKSYSMPRGNREERHVNIYLQY